MTIQYPLIIDAVDTKHFPHCVTISYDDLPDADSAVEWVDQIIGSEGDRWSVRYMFLSTNFYFRNAEDAVFFSLKWNTE